MKILLGQNVPRGLRRTLAEHDVKTALQLGWDTLANGDLIDAVEKEGFDVIVTAMVDYHKAASPPFTLVRWRVTYDVAALHRILTSCQNSLPDRPPHDQPIPATTGLLRIDQVV